MPNGIFSRREKQERTLEAVGSKSVLGDNRRFTIQDVTLFTLWVRIRCSD
jgi:hypothetical protein